MELDRLYLVLALAVIAIGAIIYLLKANLIGNYVLRVTAKSYGEESGIYQASKKFAENPVYLLSYRFVAGVVAAVAIAMAFYLVL